MHIQILGPNNVSWFSPSTVRFVKSHESHYTDYGGIGCC